MPAAQQAMRQRHNRGSSRSPISSSTWATGTGRPASGRKLLAVVHALVADGDCIDDLEFPPLDR